MSKCLWCNRESIRKGFCSEKCEGIYRASLARNEFQSLLNFPQEYEKLLN